MKKKFYETASFKKLNKEWYAKLRAEGFEDTESSANIGNDSINKQEFKVNPAWVKYNRQCEEYLNSGKITDGVDVFIFTHHCDGRSNREIVILLTESNFPQLDRRTIDRRLLRILEVAGIDPVDFGSV